MENDQMENLKSQAKDFAKQSGKNVMARILECLKKSFSFAGRASRADFWTFLVAFILLYVVEMVVTGLCGLVFAPFFLAVLGIIFLVLNLLLLIPLVSVSVRRLHDLGLSGFWMWYLSCVGLPIVFVVNFLNLDESCNTVLERVSKVCNNWVAWLFLPFFWFVGAPTVMFLLFLYKGKPEENMFGPSPYANLQ